MVRPIAGDPMEGASYLRLHRSRGLQGSALVLLYFSPPGVMARRRFFFVEQLNGRRGKGLRKNSLRILKACHHIANADSVADDLRPPLALTSPLRSGNQLFFRRLGSAGRGRREGQFGSLSQNTSFLR